MTHDGREIAFNIGHLSVSPFSRIDLLLEATRRPASASQSQPAKGVTINLTASGDYCKAKLLVTHRRFVCPWLAMVTVLASRGRTGETGQTGEAKMKRTGGADGSIRRLATQDVQALLGAISFTGVMRSTLQRSPEGPTDGEKRQS